MDGRDVGGFFFLLVVGWAVGGWMMARKHGLCADQAPSVMWRIDASWGKGITETVHLRLVTMSQSAKTNLYSTIDQTEDEEYDVDITFEV